jgi:hypothetical protein
MLAPLLAFVASAALSLAPAAHALSPATTLTTGQAAYCSTPGEVALNQFSATYFKANSSILLYISLDTSQANVDVSANMQIRAYGDTILNRTIEICELVGGVLCPLPSLNISGESSKK